MTATAVEVRPAFHYVPPRARSLVTEATQICKAVGRELEPEQELVIDALTSMKADGTPATLSGAVVCARQNLKTFCLENIVLTRLLNPSDPGRLFVWTSQRLDTCQETFRNFSDLFTSDDFPFLKRRLSNITYGRGSEEIELADGKRLKFKARSPKSGQGLTGDLIVLDEAFALEPAHMGSLIPTLSTRRHAQVLYGSSAGHADSEVLRAVRDRGRKGGKGAPAYVEFCAPGSFDEPGCELPGCRHTTDMVGCSLDRREWIQQANPLAGRRITWEYIEDERRELPPLEFARERLGWWDKPDEGEAPPITVEDWRRQTDDASLIPADGRVVLTAEIALDRMSGSIGVAGRRADGSPHVELLDHRKGTEWLLPRLLEVAKRHPLLQMERGGKRHKAVIVDPTSPAGSLVEPLRKAGIDPVLMQSRDVAVACAGLQDAIRTGRVWHRNQPAVDVALSGAVKRDLGDGGWAFGRKKSAAVSVDITPLVVVTNALWGLENSAQPAKVNLW